MPAAEPVAGAAGRAEPNAPPSHFGPFEFGGETLDGSGPRSGRLTDLAVRRFREQVGLDADGEAGRQTLGAIERAQEGLRGAVLAGLEAISGRRS